MKVFAYCTELAARAVGEATRVVPLTSPPSTHVDIQPETLEGYDLLYFRLHGIPNVPIWFGEDRKGEYPALTAENLSGADLSGSVVVVANCYGSDSPLVCAFYHAGARAVIAGTGSNYASGKRVIGTDKLVRSLIRALARGWSLPSALRWAKMSLLATSWRGADRDAYKFQIMNGGKP